MKLISNQLLMTICAFFNTSVFCIGLIQSKHIGINESYLSEPLIRELSGKLSMYEYKRIIDYFKHQNSENIHNPNEKLLIAKLIKSNVNIMKVLGINKLRAALITQKPYQVPWFLQEIGLLPLICSCTNRCLVDPLICTKINYFVMLIDQLERNIHRVDTKHEHELFLDSISILNTYLTSLLKRDITKLEKKYIIQAIERLTLIKNMFMVNQKAKHLP